MAIGRWSLAFSDIKTEIADFGMGMNLALTRAVGFFSFDSRRKSPESGKIRKARPGLSRIFPSFAQVLPISLPMSNISSRPSGRLASLDVLRGFDLFLLVFLQPVLWGLLSQWESPLAQALLFQLDHEIWEGFRCWDLVMPLFLFMSGISMPFALSKYLRGDCPRGQALRKVLRRFVILFLLGMVVQGNLLWLKWEYVQPFTNTLQAIAVGYLVTALILLSRLSLGRQMLVAVGLLAAYTIPMMWVGDYTLEGNLASRIDALVLGSRRGDPTYA